LIILILVCITFFFVSYTPLREYIPGYSNPGVRKLAIELTIKADSLQKVIDSQGVFLKNIQNIIEGKDIATFDPHQYKKDSNYIDNISFAKTTEDSLFRLEIEEKQRYNLFNDRQKEDISFSKIIFFNPVNGVIISEFDVEEQHYGIDIVTNKNEPVKSVLKGTVVFSSWTSETGHVIAIQHKNGFYSTYKHNAVVLKEIGDMVESGEVIAIVGESGELTTGPHLHFELWHHGIPVNPENFILF